MSARGWVRALSVVLVLSWWSDLAQLLACRVMVVSVMSHGGRCDESWWSA